MNIQQIVSYIQDLHLPIKNKYISIADLNLFIDELEPILKSAINSRDTILNGFHPSLDIIFPAMSHLKLFLTDWEMGSLLLVSKKIYQSMVTECGQLQVDICIIEYYLKDIAKSTINIDFNVQDKIIAVPISSSIIAKRKLRIAIGPKLFFEKYNHIFFSADIEYLINKEKSANIVFSTLVCIFCGKTKNINDDHRLCLGTHIKNITTDILPTIPHYSFEKEHIKKDNFVYPQLELIANEYRKKNMPERMLTTCKGRFSYTGQPAYSKPCYKCKLPYFIHCVDYDIMWSL